MKIKRRLPATLRSILPALFWIAVIGLGLGLRERLTHWFNGNSVAVQESTVSTAAHDHGVWISAQIEIFQRLYDDYEMIQQSLAEDKFEGVSSTAQKINESLGALEKKNPDPHMAELFQNAVRQSKRLSEADGLANLHEPFGELSRVLVNLATLEPRLAQGRYLFTCPMATGYQKWFQNNQTLKNPYMGKKMQQCGSPSSWEDEEMMQSGMSDEVAFYTCSMHPSVKQDSMGTCPICSMDLTPVTQSELETGVIMVDAQRRQQIGVRTAAIMRRPFELEIRTVGTITYDETRLQDINLRIGGWLSELQANAVGNWVNKNSTLFKLYSPKLYSVQNELLSAKKSGRGNLEQLAKRRLLLWGISEAQINEILNKGSPIEYLSIFSPIDGFIVEKNVVEGGYVSPGERIFRLADLTTIWVVVDLYEGQLSWIKQGQEVKIKLPYQPGKLYTTTVSYIYPDIRNDTRTGRIRIELPNPKLNLLPGMYADIDLRHTLGERILVPKSAVVFTGPRRLVFVDLGEGRLQPREIKVGLKNNSYFEVLEGLEEGDIVVTSGNFLVASESRIRSAAKYWGGSNDEE